MSIHRQSAMDPDSSNFLLEEGVVNSAYRVGLLSLSGEEEEQSVQMIAIAQFNRRNLVAVPSQAWHKKVLKRVLPQNGLLKPTAIEVLVVDPEDMDTILEGMKMRLWVGFLVDELFSAVDFSLMEFDSDYFFEVNGTAGYLPFAQSLMEVANEHYAFFSAGEEGAGADGSLANGASGSGDMASRLERMEIMMADLYENLPQRLARPLVRREPEPRVAFSPSTSFQPRHGGSLSPPAQRVGVLRKPAASSGALDPMLVFAAMQAGVEGDALDEVARLMSRNPKALKVKDMSAGLQPDPLSDAEEDELEEGDAAAGGGGDALQQAVISLTEIMKSLTDDKKKSSVSKIENALEYSGAVGSGKRSAAACRALRQMLLAHPEELYALLERMMMEDLMSQTLAPGMPTHAL